MNDEQHYTLDCTGMVVARAALGPDDVRYANAAIDRLLGGAPVGKFSVLELDPVFMDLMTQPWIVAACTRVLGDRFRFDHAFGLEQPTQHANLHGGPQAGHGAAFYYGAASAPDRAGVGRLSVGIALTGQSPETGGLAYVPGSHRSSYLLHGSKVLSDILGNNFRSECVHVPRLEPGDVYLFPDCLVHGTTPWTAPARRRALYYMYSPGYMAWRPYAEIEKYLPLARTPLQRRLLRPPFVTSYDEVGMRVGDNRWREPNS